MLKQDIFFPFKTLFNSFKNIFDKKHPDMEEYSKFILLTIIHVFSFISFLRGMNQNIPGRTHIRSRSPRSKASGQ